MSTVEVGESCEPVAATFLGELWVIVPAVPVVSIATPATDAVSRVQSHLSNEEEIENDQVLKEFWELTNNASFFTASAS